MIDITNCERLLSGYGGSEQKFAISYNGNTYMIKEPDPIREKNNQLSYMNNTFSEHIGCQIFSMLNIPVQETFLAKYTRTDGKTEIVVACKDFRKPGQLLYEADSLSKSIINRQDRHKPDYEKIEQIFTDVERRTTEDVKQRFWDTFVVDALIGNKDRHLGNWGFLSSDERHLEMAPVYDCGSSLGALANNEHILKCLEKPGELSTSECNISTKFKYNGNSVTYRDMLFNPPKELIKAIKNIVPKIDLNGINQLVDLTPELSDLRKQFIKKSVAMRYEKILIPALKKIQKQEKINAIMLSTKPSYDATMHIFIEHYNHSLLQNDDPEAAAVKATKAVIKFSKCDSAKALSIMYDLLPQIQKDDIYPIKIMQKVKEDPAIAECLAKRNNSKAQWLSL